MAIRGMTFFAAESSDACRGLTASSLYAMLDNNNKKIMLKAIWNGAVYDDSRNV
jgi:hypothetical protein